MSESAINIPQPVLQALSAALIKKLDPATTTLQKAPSSASSDVPPLKESPAFISVVNEVLATLLRNTVSAQPSPSPRTPQIAAPFSVRASPRTPQNTVLNLTPDYVRISDLDTPTCAAAVVNLPGTPLSRTSSNASSVSSSSAKSFTDNKDDDVAFIKKRKPSVPQDLADIKVVTAPILAKFDSNWLARFPKDENNPMFEFRVRSGVGFGRQPPRKKYSDLVVPFFKRNARPIIRRLVTANLREEQQRNPDITYEDLRRRYENCALKVVRKRRANHVQSWRPDRNGTHCPLIYGGDAVPASSSSNNDTPQVNTINNEPKKTDTAGVNNVVTNVTPRVNTTNTEPKKQTDTAGVVFLNDPETLTCKDCGTELVPVDAYPKERWGSDSDDV